MPAIVTLLFALRNALQRRRSTPNYSLREVARNRMDSYTIVDTEVSHTEHKGGGPHKA